ncbi:hypothetical protein Glove_441g8 [Diversispora epigaea]|uniref:Uncharacterized protein n=1 Tax=Diversispora epigaea TaxID=1348612 RepID=A0A397GVG3_9GLOM|nr:hypothetical protein Glove_441g8 [Diversispora epigaea]
MLDTNKNPFECAIPSSFEINYPPSIWGLTANLYNEYTFGFIIDTLIYSSQVYFYNIKSNKWVTTFNPSLPSKLSSTASKSTATFNPIITSLPSKKAFAIGLGTGIGVAVLIRIFIAILFVVERGNVQILLKYLAAAIKIKTTYL